MSWTSERINRIFEGVGLDTYLEIGIEHGSNLRDVQAGRSVGVDPNPTGQAVDFAEHIEIHRVTSDEYFDHLDPLTRFDCVFIDGLHEFEQSLRDLLWSMAFSHDRTVFILDDTRPDTYHGALPLSRQPGEVREAMGSPSHGWMGDVYKTLAFVNDFVPQLSFASLKDKDQTILWKDPRPSRAPLFTGLEQISRMEYSHFLLLQDTLFRAEPEDEVLDRVRAWLERPSD